MKLINGVPNWSKRGADTWNPFKSIPDELKINVSHRVFNPNATGGGNSSVIDFKSFYDMGYKKLSWKINGFSSGGNAYLVVDGINVGNTVNSTGTTNLTANSSSYLWGSYTRDHSMNVTYTLLK